MFAFSLTKIVSTVSDALNQYNKELSSYVEAHAAPYLWAEGGEWPAYIEQFHNMFPNLHNVVANTIKYVKCFRLAQVKTHLDDCINSGTVCAMYVPYSLEYKMDILQQLTQLYPSRRVTVVVQSSAAVLYLQTLLSNLDAHAFTSGLSPVNWKDKIEFVSPAKLMYQISANKNSRYGVLVLDEANNSNMMYTLLRRVLPFVSEFPVYLDACDVDSGELLQVTSPTVASARVIDSNALLVGHTENARDNVSPTMIGSIPVDGYASLCDTGRRPIPVVEEGAYVTLYHRHATAYEKNKTISWARVNGYRLMSTVVNANKTIKHQIGADSYTTLLWAIEIVTGIRSGDIATARRIWMSSGFFTNVILDPISLSLTNNMSINLPVHMSGVTDNGSIWNIYQYSNELYTNFVYEQTAVQVVGQSITLRIGYESRYGRSPIYRLMITQSPGQICQTNEFVVPKFLRYYYSIINKSLMCGFDILADNIPCDKSVLTPVDIEDARWVLANRMLPSYHASELIAVVSLWNKHTTGIQVGVRGGDLLRMFCDYFEKC